MLYFSSCLILKYFFLAVFIDMLRYQFFALTNVTGENELSACHSELESSFLYPSPWT